MKTPMQTIRERQGKLEDDLNKQTSIIGDIVSGFVKDTGMPVSDVRFTFIDATTIGSSYPEYVIGGVKVWYGE